MTEKKVRDFPSCNHILSKVKSFFHSRILLAMVVIHVSFVSVRIFIDFFFFFFFQLSSQKEKAN